jgi:hypothetical protein
VFSRFGHLLLIVALLGATGAHWVVLQSVAWATMFADNARTESLQEAVQKTFDGRHPCALCKQIAKGRQSEQKPDQQQTELKRLEFLHGTVALVIQSPKHFRWLPEPRVSAILRVQTPPVPPPRILPG